MIDDEELLNLVFFVMNSSEQNNLEYYIPLFLIFFFIFILRNLIIFTELFLWLKLLLKYKIIKIGFLVQWYRFLCTFEYRSIIEWETKLIEWENGTLIASTTWFCFIFGENVPQWIGNKQIAENLKYYHVYP